MGANVAESETNESLDSTISNDSIGDRERALMDKCLKLLMQNQAPLLSPPSVKVICISFAYLLLNFLLVLYAF